MEPVPQSVVAFSRPVQPAMCSTCFLLMSCTHSLSTQQFCCCLSSSTCWQLFQPSAMFNTVILYGRHTGHIVYFHEARSTSHV